MPIAPKRGPYSFLVNQFISISVIEPEVIDQLEDATAGILNEIIDYLSQSVESAILELMNEFIN